jgi:hypothetical protein
LGVLLNVARGGLVQRDRGLLVGLLRLEGVLRLLGLSVEVGVEEGRGGQSIAGRLARRGRVLVGVAQS